MRSLISLLNRIRIIDKNDYYLEIDSALACNKKRFVVTANPEIIMMGRKNNDMYHILLDKKVEMIPDGIGLVKSLRMIYKNKSIQRNTGIELVQFLLKSADEKQKSIFIYGSKEEVLADFLRICKRKYPNIRFDGCYNGYTNNEDDIIEIAIQSDADIYFAALGTPRQELFLRSIFLKKQKGIFVGIGGSLDVLSGQSKRAPEFFLKHNLEWLYRITKEPNRIKRFIRSNICYIFVFISDYMQWKN